MYIMQIRTCTNITVGSNYTSEPWLIWRHIGCLTHGCVKKKSTNINIKIYIRVTFLSVTVQTSIVSALRLPGSLMSNFTIINTHKIKSDRMKNITKNSRKVCYSTEGNACCGKNVPYLPYQGCICKRWSDLGAQIELLILHDVWEANGVTI